jgi:hypothetical protein
MNDFSELENQLRNLRPLAPSDDLVDKISRGLAAPSNSRPSVAADRNAGWHWPWRSARMSYRIGLGLAAAAGAAAALLLYTRSDIDRSPKKAPSVATISTAPAGKAPVASSGEFVPATLTEVVYNRRDEGLRFPAGSDQPMRRFRWQKQETVQWHNRLTGASLRVTYPAEEISLVRAPGQ